MPSRFIVALFAFAPAPVLGAFRALAADPTFLHAPNFTFAVVVLGVALLGGLGVTLLFIYRVSRNPEQAFVWKLGWVVALAAAALIANPVYWLLHVRTEPARAA